MLAQECRLSLKVSDSGAVDSHISPKDGDTPVRGNKTSPELFLVSATVQAEQSAQTDARHRE
jgi:hypothetical protein